MCPIVDQIAGCKVIPVVAIDSVSDALPLADALTAGGLPVAEITLRTEAGIKSIRSLADREQFLVGAGTVHSVQQAQQVAEAGARFIVSPGFNPKTVQWCLDHSMPIFPGVSSPTDLELALEFGLQVVKFFPAEQLGGVDMIRALSGPFAGVRFIPTGGIHAANLAEYLRLPQVVACGGTWMAPPDMIRANRFDEITKLTAQAVTA